MFIDFIVAMIISMFLNSPLSNRGNIVETFQLETKVSVMDIFANDFVNKSKVVHEITIENFKRALDFALSDCSGCVGIIGGEPTLHSKFSKILTLLINDDRVKKALIYTNGINLNRYFHLLQNPKFHFLVNCNSSKQIGSVLYNRLVFNLTRLVEYDRENSLDRVTVGYNIYYPNFDYDYIMDLLKRLGLGTLRMSIVVPDFSRSDCESAVSYFLRGKEQFLRFLDDMLNNDIVPCFDCNKMLSCLYTDQDFLYLKHLFFNGSIRKNAYLNDTFSIFNFYSKCYPVLDIYWDLTVSRCFGVSDFGKTSITEFANIKELRDYFIENVDNKLKNIPTSENCSSCREGKKGYCFGGCLGFKLVEYRRQNSDS